MKNIVRKPAPSAEAAFAASALGRQLIALQTEASPSNRLIADYLLRNPVRVTAWSIEDLSGAIAVSPATVSRFARACGFGGYPELRAAVAETLQAILQPVEKLRDAIERPRPGGSSFHDGLETSMSAVRGAVDGLDLAALDRVVAQLGEARNVYVMGFGLSSHLAGILTLGLQPFCPQLINVVEFGGTEVAAGRLMNVGRGDLLIVLSFPRYATDAVQLAAYARDRGAALVAITDSPASPLARLTDAVLLAPSQHPILSSSLAAAVVVIEALVARLMTSNRRNVAQAAKLTEAISAYLFRGDAEAAPAAKRRDKR
jgi:DNA-binding MurR/RpiR family transcriptional regulator